MMILLYVKIQMRLLIVGDNVSPRVPRKFGHQIVTFYCS